MARESLFGNDRLFQFFKWADLLKKTDAQTVIDVIRGWWNQGWGLPSGLRADDGPEFRSKFTNFSESVGVKRETSSAYHPYSNGLAEQRAPAVKKAIKKLGYKADLQHVINDLNSLERSNIPATPAELMSGRVIRSSLPASVRRSVDLAIIRQKSIKTQERAFKRLNRGRINCQNFKEGDGVRV